MSEWFKSWRTKVGLVTLVFACGVASAWVRSFSGVDYAIARSVGGSSYHIESRRGTVECARRSPGVRGPRFSYGRVLFDEADDDEYDFWEHLKIRWRVTLLGFDFGAGNNTGGTIRTIESWTVPYWAITAPLIILSAWSLLSKPRQKPSAPVQDIHP